jgi:mannosyltransferase
MSARPAPSRKPDPRDVEVITPNFNRRLSGVTSTLERLLPIQAQAFAIAALGPGLSPSLPYIRWTDIPALARKPANKPFRIWHARRNIEMLAGVVLRDVLRFPLKLVFTSASQRQHTTWSRFLISRMDAVISTSAATASYLKRPSTVIGHGIDAALFHPAKDRAAARAAVGLPDFRFVGSFGRIRHQKGSDVFVDAMLRILPERPDTAAVILGRVTGEHSGFMSGLTAKIKAAGLSGRILFAGEVSPSAIAGWYRALDVFVAPQRWEGFGVTPLEAMASGVPVVATRVGAFPDILTDETGILINAGDGQAMAGAVARLLDNSGLADAMGRAGLVRARSNFTLETEAKRIGDVYSALWDKDSENSRR